MALRVPMLVLLSGTLVGGVAATHIAPQLFSGVQQSTAAQSEAPALALATSAEAASGPQIADPQPVKKASSSAGCKEAAWPYRDRSCTAASDAAPSKPERQVRVISTDRDAPSRVPVPKSVVAQTAPVQTGASVEPERAAAPQAMASSDDAASRPAPAAKAETVETTSSIRPARPGAVARNHTPTRRQVARVERPRRDMSERIRQARRNFDDDDTQTTTYQYTDGRQLVFRSEPQRQERRRWVADQQAAPMPRVEPRPAHDSIFGWLGQF
jgi:hypothetical protein